MTDEKVVLLVDDSVHDLELIQMAIRDQKGSHRVEVVHDGAEALDYLRQNGRTSSAAPGALALILLDLKMPRVDGLEVLRQIKADDKLKHIPVVMLTSSGDEGDLNNCYDAGANAYVVKPIDFQEFMNTIRQTWRFWLSINVCPVKSVPETSSVANSG